MTTTYTNAQTFQKVLDEVVSCGLVDRMLVERNGKTVVDEYAICFFDLKTFSAVTIRLINDNTIIFKGDGYIGFLPIPLNVTSENLWNHVNSLVPVFERVREDAYETVFAQRGSVETFDYHAEG